MSNLQFSMCMCLGVFLDQGHLLQFVASVNWSIVDEGTPVKMSLLHVKGSVILTRRH